MNLQQPFKEGVLGVLHVDWLLQLETPLSIHNGMKAAYKQQDASCSKGRGMHKDFVWLDANAQVEQDGWSEVTDLNYAFTIDGERAQVNYAVPGSSIRGSLRNAALKSFVAPPERGDFSLPKKPETATEQEKEKRQAIIDRALLHLKNAESGWYDVLSLFGCVFELEEKKNEPKIWSGRLRLSSELCDSDKARIDGIPLEISADDGPQNINRHILVRNPLDRVTHAAKEGGLHFRMEIDKGERFRVHMEILNPRAKDIELLEEWCQDINDGFLRFGASSSQGRGRAKICEESYTIYVQKYSPLGERLEKLQPDDIISDDDPFKDIWRGAQLTLEQLKDLELS